MTFMGPAVARKVNEAACMCDTRRVRASSAACEANLEEVGEENPSVEEENDRERRPSAACALAVGQRHRDTEGRAAHLAHVCMSGKARGSITGSGRAKVCVTLQPSDYNLSSRDRQANCFAGLFYRHQLR